jgi:hypothetical protein
VLTRQGRLAKKNWIVATLDANGLALQLGSSRRARPSDWSEKAVPAWEEAQRRAITNIYDDALRPLGLNGR